jgi:electron transport complex protein RnfG
VSKVKYFVEQSWLLIVASFCFGLLIAGTNRALSKKIEQNKAEKVNRLVRSLLPDAEHFTLLDTEFEIKSLHGEKQGVAVYEAASQSGERVGYNFNAAGSGFADKIELVVAVDKDFAKLKGFEVLASNETPNFGDQIKLPYFRDQFAGAPAQELKLVRTGDVRQIDSEIIAITGATVSSEAVVEIINNALTQIKNQMQKAGLISGHEDTKSQRN